MLLIAFIMLAIVVAAFATRRLCVQKTERPHVALDAQATSSTVPTPQPAPMYAPTSTPQHRPVSIYD